LAQYAEQKSKQASDGEMAAFAEPWDQLAIDLASASVSFAEAIVSYAIRK
jgi:hypothetical protein